LGEYLKTPLETPYLVVWVDTQIPIPSMVDEMDDTEIAELCETLTDSELDLLILQNHPLAQRCLDLENLDEILDEQAEEEERIEEEVKRAIEESAKEVEEEQEKEKCCKIERDGVD